MLSNPNQIALQKGIERTSAQQSLDKGNQKHNIVHFECDGALRYLR